MDLYRYTENLSQFVEIARDGSFSSVARKLGVNPSSIMRKIDILEDVMGIKLLVRSPRGVLLTDAGEALFKRATHILDELHDVHNEIGSFHQKFKGVLRISCFPTFAKLHIFPWLSEFKGRYPEIDLVLDLTERLTNPSLERLDAAIRIGALKDSSLYATSIANQRWVACASPSYVQRYGRPNSVEQLGEHHLLDKYHDPNSICWSRVMCSESEVSPHIYLRCNDFDALRLAAVNSLGIAFLPNWVVSSDIKAGRLEKIFDDPQQQVEAIHILRALPKISPKLLVFLEALSRHLDKELGEIPTTAVL